MSDRPFDNDWPDDDDQPDDSSHDPRDGWEWIGRISIIGDAVIAEVYASLDRAIAEGIDVEEAIDKLEHLAEIVHFTDDEAYERYIDTVQAFALTENLVDVNLAQWNVVSYGFKSAMEAFADLERTGLLFIGGIAYDPEAQEFYPLVRKKTP
jgi:hypothetical protein